MLKETLGGSMDRSEREGRDEGMVLAVSRRGDHFDNSFGGKKLPHFLLHECPLVSTRLEVNATTL